jgi:cysteinyl-tRNA synthetase
MQKKTQLQLVQSLLEVEKEVRKVLDVLGLLSSFSYAEVIYFTWVNLSFEKPSQREGS